jgi:hypothetical protein
MKSGRGNVWSINYMNIDKKRKMMVGEQYEG